MENLPHDTLYHVLTFIINDGHSIGRLSICSRTMYNSINYHIPNLWTEAIQLRWPSNPLNVTTVTKEINNVNDDYSNETEHTKEDKDIQNDTLNIHDEEKLEKKVPSQSSSSSSSSIEAESRKIGTAKEEDFFRLEYIRRDRIDHEAIKILHSMTNGLQHLLGVVPKDDGDGDEDNDNDDDHNDDDHGRNTDAIEAAGASSVKKQKKNNNLLPLADGSPHIGQAWYHPYWKGLIVQRKEVIDILKSLARTCLTQGTREKDGQHHHQQEQQQQPSNFSHYLKANTTTTIDTNTTSTPSPPPPPSSSSSYLDQRVLGFLALRGLQNIHFAESLREWKTIHELQISSSTSLSSQQEQEESQRDQSRNLSNLFLLDGNTDSSVSSTLSPTIATSPTKKSSSYINALLLEKYALLICRIQQTPPELLQEGQEEVKNRNVKTSDDDGVGTQDGQQTKTRTATKDNHTKQLPVTESILNQLDEIANVCKDRIQERFYDYNDNINHQNTSTTTQSTTTTRKKRRPTVEEKIQIVKEVLVDTYQFQGNVDNYYDYRNSLLNFVLASKQGIPITLCILYTCVCRRLDIDVHLTGLPGHVVLGYYKNDDADENEDYDNDNSNKDGSPSSSSLGFLDVFRSGKTLTLTDCKNICNMYGIGWDDVFLKPLSASHVLRRILNNLTNCHIQAMASNLLFHSDLFFQQRALDAIHRQPEGIAGPLVDRVAEEFPLTLSPDLLRYYGLLSPLE